MKIAVLSKKAALYSTNRLVEAAKQRGHEVEVIDYLRCYMSIRSQRPQIFYKGQSLENIEAVVPRIGASNTFYGTAVVRQFEMMGRFTLNRSQAISRSRDKLRSLQILAKHGIGMPVTGCAHSTRDVQGVIATVGGAPTVVKLLEGTQGIGVVLAETQNAAESVIEAFRGLKANIIVQEFIQEAKGNDIRCFVIGDKVVASMMRMAREGEFRSNLHRGGHAKKVKISPQERMTAVKAAKALGLAVAGVDILRSNHGPVVLEVNSSPGLEGIEKYSETDVASQIIEYIEKNSGTGHKKDRILG
jgi:ribosomal protein S6--L-glutamate ligase